MVLARFALADWLDDNAQLLPFIMAVMAAAWSGGLGPGLLATLLGTLAGCYFFVPPVWSLAIERSSDAVHLLVFVAVGVLISGLCEALHATRRRLEGKQEQLENEVQVRRQAEEELRRADRSKSESLAILAHELRNMLAPVNFALYAMEQTADRSETVERHRKVIGRHIRQMTRLIEDLLSASCLTSNKLELRKEPVALAEILQSAVEASRPLIEAAAQDLVVSLPPEPIRLAADPAWLGQVFTNLLNNAAKYTDRGGHITLTARRQGAAVVVRVSDDGIGIPADALPHIFDMFMQVERSSERSRGGLGIGLSLVQRLVELHGGTVEVDSDGPGKGSDFVVHLPVLGDAEQPRTQAPGADPVCKCRRPELGDDLAITERMERLIQQERKGCPGQP
jgi:signal transduction histidine kinase